MKNDKHKITDSVAEIVVEILFIAILFGVGLAVCLGIEKIFSVETENFDFVFIGLLSFAVIIVILNLVKRVLKYLRSKKK